MTVANYPQIGQGQAGYAQQAAQLQGQTDKVQPLLQDQIERLELHAKDLDMLADRFHGLADRLLGSRPEGVANQTAVPTPSHAIAQMNEMHSRIERTRERLQDALHRLERL